MRSALKSSTLAAAAWLALAAATSAQAQSSVSLYGLVDMSVGQFQNAGALKNKAVASGNMTTSFFGFKGTEDLGGGLSARFALESFMRANTGEAGRFGGDAFWARSAYVGLASSTAGSLNLGRNTTSLFVSALAFNSFGDSFGFSPTIRHYFTSSTVTGDTGWSDSASYTSPKLGGATVQLQAADPGAAGGGRNVGGSVMFFDGKLGATVAAQNVKKGSTVDDTKTVNAGVSYDFGGLKAFAQFGKVTNDTKSTDFKLTDLSVAVPVGDAKVLAAVGVLRANTGTRTTTTSLGYDYAMSKRTDVYAVFMNDKKSSLTTGHTYAVGVRHRF